MLADKEKAAENTLCILKGFDAVRGHFRPAEPRVLLLIDAINPNENSLVSSFSNNTSVCYCHSLRCYVI